MGPASQEGLLGTSHGKCGTKTFNSIGGSADLTVVTARGYPWPFDRRCERKIDWMFAARSRSLGPKHGARAT
jgi:hypothetical protein